MSNELVDMFLPPEEMSLLVLKDEQGINNNIEVIDVITAVEESKKKADSLGNGSNWMNFFVAEIQKSQGLKISKTAGALLISIAMKKWVELKNFSSPEQQGSASGESQSQTTQE